MKKAAMLKMRKKRVIRWSEQASCLRCICALNESYIFDKAVSCYEIFVCEKPEDKLRSEVDSPFSAKSLARLKMKNASRGKIGWKQNKATNSPRVMFPPTFGSRSGIPDDDDDDDDDDEGSTPNLTHLLFIMNKCGMDDNSKTRRELLVTSRGLRKTTVAYLTEAALDDASYASLVLGLRRIGDVGEVVEVVPVGGFFAVDVVSPVADTVLLVEGSFVGANVRDSAAISVAQMEDLAVELLTGVVNRVTADDDVGEESWQLNVTGVRRELMIYVFSRLYFFGSCKKENLSLALFVQPGSQCTTYTRPRYEFSFTAVVGRKRREEPTGFENMTGKRISKS
ncbi:unnamed protein product, partial [Notodromas monacha]